MRVILNCLFFIFPYYALFYTLVVIIGSCHQFPVAYAASIGVRDTYALDWAEGLPESCVELLAEDGVYDRSGDADLIPISCGGDVEPTSSGQSGAATSPFVPRGPATESSAAFEDSLRHRRPPAPVPTSTPIIISVLPVPIPFLTFTFTAPIPLFPSSTATSSSPATTTSSITSSVTTSASTTSSTSTSSSTSTTSTVSTTTTTSPTTTLSSPSSTTASTTSTSPASSSTPESLSSGSKLSGTLIAVITMLSFLGILSLALGIIVLLRTRKRRLAAIQRMPDVESRGQPQTQAQAQLSTTSDYTHTRMSSAAHTYLGSRFSVTTIASDESAPTPEMSVVEPSRYYATMFSGRRSLGPSLPNPYDGRESAHQAGSRSDSR
ncbi:hypothetical protein CONPUDRAFT_148572 [Coniophora puteana RWD-64-598 SS2]|uniref:Mid2 domain-containing protein n=1 Tax=Coniophora puteana (strain RWD-64-598) TaxID=741705 RepID=A0A5M3N500_CONPW|nr:uncharacterized protein CONPUDRAFT_148572 [Coniophora puteana RWD-64-598 SS2]EIW86489.1 hypothetical protein CONPUDRAFT_148572 [Coniophora puteana RWD-64-598 SS2]